MKFKYFIPSILLNIFAYVVFSLGLKDFLFFTVFFKGDIYEILFFAFGYLLLNAFALVLTGGFEWASDNDNKQL